MKERDADVRRQRDIKLTKERIKRKLDEADQSEIATAGAETDFWLKFVKPLMETQIDYFNGHTLTMLPAEFEKEQWAAQKMTMIIDYVESTMGKEEELRGQAEKLQRMLEDAGAGMEPDPGEG